VAEAHVSVYFGFVLFGTSKSVPSPQKIAPSPKSFQNALWTTSRNPRNGAAILPVPRLNPLRSN
jgi:hypothetical protein